MGVLSSSHCVSRGYSQRHTNNKMDLTQQGSLVLQKGAQGPKFDKRGHRGGCPRVLDVITQDGDCVISTWRLTSQSDTVS